MEQTPSARDLPGPGGITGISVAQTLMNDLDTALYGRRLEHVQHKHLQEPAGEPFLDTLRNVGMGFSNLIVLQLHHMSLFGSDRPASHIFADMIAAISFLQGNDVKHTQVVLLFKTILTLIRRKVLKMTISSEQMCPQFRLPMQRSFCTSD